MELRGRTGIVMGAESPIGAMIARALVEAGARVVAAGIGAPALVDDAVPSGGEVRPEALDFVVDAVPLPACPPLLAETAGLEEAMVGATRSLMALVALAPRLSRGGAMVCVSAPLGPTPEEGWLLPLLAWRAAAVEALAREFAPKGVRVNGLAPVLDGAAKLPGFLKRGAPKVAAVTPLGRVAEPVEVAQAALWLLGAGMVTGLTLPLDGGRGL